MVTGILFALLADMAMLAYARRHRRGVVAEQRVRRGLRLAVRVG